MTRKPLTILLDGDPQAPQQARLGAALAARGMRVVVLDAPAVAKQIRGEFKQTCEELTSLPRWLGPVRGWLLQRAVRRLGVDVVHLNYLSPRQRVWADAPDGPPYVATAWGSDLNREAFQFSDAHEAQLDVVLRHASAVTADSLPLLRKAKARMGQSPAPTELVYWSADLAEFEPTKARAQAAAFRQQLGIGADVRVLLSPRQPRPHYFVDRIIAAFAESAWATQGVLVLKSHGKVSEDKDMQQLLALAHKLGVGDRVLTAPRVAYDELAGIYAMADAAVSMPEADGVPSTFLELMALEVPIVATDLPGYEGVLVDQERALLVPPGDHAALVGALNRLWTEPELARHLTTHGRTWALAHADWRHGVDQWIALYDHALTHPRP